MSAAHRRLMEARQRLLDAGSPGRAALVELLQHEHPGVRLWAASHVARTHPDLAVPVLTSLMHTGPSLLAFEAKMVLAQVVDGNH